MLGGKRVGEELPPLGKRHYFISCSMNDQLRYRDQGEFFEVVEMAGNNGGEYPEEGDSSCHIPGGGKGAFKNQGSHLSLEGNFRCNGTTQGPAEKDDFFR